MSILSITFHAEQKKIEEWEQYLKNQLIPEIENLNKKYILSEVETEMLSEGKNTNILIFFDSNDERISFLETIFPAISEKIITEFQEYILIFKTFLNTISTKI